MSNILLSGKGTLAQVLSAELSVIEQLPTLLPGATIPVNGTPMTIAQIVAQLTAHGTTINAIAASKVTTGDLVVTQKGERLGVRTTMQAIKAYVAGTLGTSSAAYSLLGFKPNKRTAPTAATKAEAAEKAQATRLKRHILGKKQRAEIPPAAAPVTAPAPEPTPAPSAEPSAAVAPVAAVAEAPKH